MSASRFDGEVKVNIKVTEVIILEIQIVNGLARWLCNGA